MTSNRSSGIPPQSFRQVCAEPPGRGTLVMLEGADGCGKTTILRRLASIFKGAVVTARVPGEDVPEELERIWRRMLHNGDALTFPYVWQGYAFCNNMESQARVHRQALEQGQLVIADRGWPSSICYGLAAGCSWEWLRGMVRPLYYPETTLVFLHKHVDGSDAVERDDAFQTKVRLNYRALLEQEAPRWWEVPSLSVDQTVSWAQARIRKAFRAKERAQR